MNITTEYLKRTLSTLEGSLSKLQACQANEEDADIYRHAVVKGFELTLELVGKLLCRALKAYGGSPKEVDALFYKDVFRHVAKRGLITTDAVERWFRYRDNRNDTAHDYGESFANNTISLLPKFIADSKALEIAISGKDFTQA